MHDFSHFHHIPNRMPFDDSSGAGYAISYLIQVSGSASICAVIYLINSLFFGICWYVRSLLFDLNSIFTEISEVCDKQTTMQISARNVKCYSLFRDYIKRHYHIIRYLFRIFVHIHLSYELIITELLRQVY